MSSKSGAKDDGAVMVTEENKSGGQKAAEAEVEGFRRKLGPFVVAAETTRMPMVFTDAEEPEHPIIFANGSFLSLTGYSLEEVLAQNFIFLMAQGNEPEALATIQTAFTGHARPFPEICSHRKDGSALWVSLYVSPVLDENGDVVQHLVSMADLTGQRRERDRLRFLLGELSMAV